LDPGENKKENNWKFSVRFVANKLSRQTFPEDAALRYYSTWKFTATASKHFYTVWKFPWNENILFCNTCDFPGEAKERFYRQWKCTKLAVNYFCTFWKVPGVKKYVSASSGTFHLSKNNFAYCRKITRERKKVFLIFPGMFQCPINQYKVKRVTRACCE